MRPLMCSVVFLTALLTSIASAQSLRLAPPAMLEITPLARVQGPVSSADSQALRRAEVLTRLGVPVTALAGTALWLWSTEGAPWTMGEVERGYGCGGYNTLAAAGPLLVGGLALTIAGAISTRRLRQRGAHPPRRNYAARILGVTLLTVGASALTGLALFSDAFCNT